jgi:hypothetical protein
MILPLHASPPDKTPQHPARSARGRMDLAHRADRITQSSSVVPMIGQAEKQCRHEPVSGGERGCYRPAYSCESLRIPCRPCSCVQCNHTTSVAWEPPIPAAIVAQGTQEPRCDGGDILIEQEPHPCTAIWISSAATTCSHTGRTPVCRRSAYNRSDEP